MVGVILCGRSVRCYGRGFYIMAADMLHRLSGYTLPFAVCYTTYKKFFQGDCVGTLAPWRLRSNVKYLRRTMA